MTTGEFLVPIGEKAALSVFMREYVAEMNAILRIAGGDNAYPYFDLYWSEPAKRWPYWLKVDEANAGFALIRREERAGRTEVAEFFVTGPHRRQGVGVAAARRLIRRYPGAWRITQRENNGAAIAFWHRVLDGFVTYDEAKTSTDAARREQMFTVL